MFTGIIETVGRVARIERRGGVQRTTIHAQEIMDGVRLGDSISVDGVCQTVIAVSAGSFTFESVAETLRLTTVGAWKTSQSVNVERSLRVGARLGGHWVLGHVDCVVRVREIRDLDDSTEWRFGQPEGLAHQVAQKGSVAIDGISLTVTDVDDASFGVAVIPFTLSHTTLGTKRVGDLVNIETDVLAKYVDRLRHLGGLSGPASGVSANLLRDAGFFGGAGIA